MCCDHSTGTAGRQPANAVSSWEVKACQSIDTPERAAPGSGESLVAGATIVCLPHCDETVAALRIIVAVAPTMSPSGQ